MIATGPALLSPNVVSPVALTIAVLLMTPQLAAVVTAATVMLFTFPGTSVRKLQLSVVPPATGEAGEQVAACGPPTVQLRPAGSVSVSTTFVELPVPPALTVML